MTETKEKLKTLPMFWNTQYTYFHIFQGNHLDQGVDKKLSVAMENVFGVKFVKFKIGRYRYYQYGTLQLTKMNHGCHNIFVFSF